MATVQPVPSPMPIAVAALEPPMPSAKPQDPRLSQVNKTNIFFLRGQLLLPCLPPFEKKNSSLTSGRQVVGLSGLENRFTLIDIDMSVAYQTRALVN